MTPLPPAPSLASDIEISRAAKLDPIERVAARVGIPDTALHKHGRYIAKVDPSALQVEPGRGSGHLVLVTAMSPTPSGEGKTTTTVGLGDALRRLGHRAMVCLREPSLGPCFGMKGGAAGGGRSQVVPMEAINLHFTGDFHAITSANNLLAAILDNHVHWGNALDIDTRRVTFRRALDMNDRALRRITSSLGGAANGYPREDGFEITVASEVMAVFCLARDLADLEDRLGRIVVARTRDRRPVTAADLKASGAMTVLLKDAFQPNIVQTLEGTPALVHGGPFANIAHGCNSLAATRLAMDLADIVVTEAGFGADLGAEKFLDIKCRQAGLSPDAVVVVATVRALKMHGGVPQTALDREDVPALRAGLANLGRHVSNMQGFGLPVAVAVNHFPKDSPAELQEVIAACRQTLGVQAFVCRHWAEGGAGAESLAAHVADLAAERSTSFRPLYPDDMPLWEKIRTVARRIYGAADIAGDRGVIDDLRGFEALGFADLPVCIAKTQYSFSADPTLFGAPSGHILPVREVRLAAGAGFVVAICGDIKTMPGLPRTPAAESIRLDANGAVQGLF